MSCHPSIVAFYQHEWTSMDDEKLCQIDNTMSLLTETKEALNISNVKNGHGYRCELLDIRKTLVALDALFNIDHEFRDIKSPPLFDLLLKVLSTVTEACRCLGEADLVSMGEIDDVHQEWSSVGRLILSFGKRVYCAIDVVITHLNDYLSWQKGNACVDNVNGQFSDDEEMVQQRIRALISWIELSLSFSVTCLSGLNIVANKVWVNDCAVPSITAAVTPVLNRFLWSICEDGGFVSSLFVVNSVLRSCRGWVESLHTAATVMSNPKWKGEVGIFIDRCYTYAHGFLKDGTKFLGASTTRIPHDENLIVLIRDRGGSIAVCSALLATCQLCTLKRNDISIMNLSWKELTRLVGILFDKGLLPIHPKDGFDKDALIIHVLMRVCESSQLMFTGLKYHPFGHVQESNSLVDVSPSLSIETASTIQKSAVTLRFFLRHLRSLCSRIGGYVSPVVFGSIVDLLVPLSAALPWSPVLDDCEDPEKWVFTPVEIQKMLHEVVTKELVCIIEVCCHFEAFICALLQENKSTNPLVTSPVLSCTSKYTRNVIRFCFLLRALRSPTFSDDMLRRLSTDFSLLEFLRICVVRCEQDLFQPAVTTSAVAGGTGILWNILLLVCRDLSIHLISMNMISLWERFLFACMLDDSIAAPSLAINLWTVLANILPMSFCRQHAHLLVKLYHSSTQQPRRRSFCISALCQLVPRLDEVSLLAVTNSTDQKIAVKCQNSEGPKRITNIDLAMWAAFLSFYADINPLPVPLSILCGFLAVRCSRAICKLISQFTSIDVADTALLIGAVADLARVSPSRPSSLITSPSLCIPSIQWPHSEQIERSLTVIFEALNLSTSDITDDLPLVSLLVNVVRLAAAYILDDKLGKLLPSIFSILLQVLLDSRLVVILSIRLAIAKCVACAARATFSDDDNMTDIISQINSYLLDNTIGAARDSWISWDSGLRAISGYAKFTKKPKSVSRIIPINHRDSIKEFFRRLPSFEEMALTVALAAKWRNFTALELVENRKTNAGLSLSRKQHREKQTQDFVNMMNTISLKRNREEKSDIELTQEFFQSTTKRRRPDACSESGLFITNWREGVANILDGVNALHRLLQQGNSFDSCVSPIAFSKLDILRDTVEYFNQIMNKYE